MQCLLLNPYFQFQFPWGQQAMSSVAMEIKISSDGWLHLSLSNQIPTTLHYSSKDPFKSGWQIHPTDSFLYRLSFTYSANLYISFCISLYIRLPVATHPLLMLRRCSSGRLWHWYCTCTSNLYIDIVSFLCCITKL